MSAQKILLIEDSEPQRKVLAEQLRAAGFVVTEASRGEEGLTVAQEQQPDLIITDIVMFPMDGFEFARKIRSSGKWGENVHIVVLTNLNDREKSTPVAPLHLNAYLIKAETPLADVVKKVQNIFNEEKGNRIPS